MSGSGKTFNNATTSSQQIQKKLSAGDVRPVNYTPKIAIPLLSVSSENKHTAKTKSSSFTPSSVPNSNKDLPVQFLALIAPLDEVLKNQANSLESESDDETNSVQPASKNF